MLQISYSITSQRCSTGFRSSGDSLNGPVWAIQTLPTPLHHHHQLELGTQGSLDLQIHAVYAKFWPNHLHVVAENEICQTRRDFSNIQLSNFPSVSCFGTSKQWYRLFSSKKKLTFTCFFIFSKTHWKCSDVIFPKWKKSSLFWGKHVGVML